MEKGANPNAACVFPPEGRGEGRAASLLFLFSFCRGRQVVGVDPDQDIALLRILPPRGVALRLVDPSTHARTRTHAHARTHTHARTRMLTHARTPRCPSTRTRMLARTIACWQHCQQAACECPRPDTAVVAEDSGACSCSRHRTRRIAGYPAPLRDVVVPTNSLPCD